MLTAVPEQTIEATSLERPWRVVGQGAAALAAGMGIGRFAYTAILPLMLAHAGLSPQLGASLATANYIGYLLGAVAAIIAPAMAASRTTLRLSLVILIATLALMPLTHVGALWWLLRLVAGVASSLIFVVAVNAMLTGLRGHAHHLTGWAFGGIGAGIALSDVVVLILRTAGLQPGAAPRRRPRRAGRGRDRRAAPSLPASPRPTAPTGRHRPTDAHQDPSIRPLISDH
ncbi:YbfB/YjiJ family MFS transporter [Nonomuraea sp. NPDC052129]|uniref:YbfB/YjiJ family MFS transporter n=1 Tax=Nonomuraea sp. NPDC052129 TaxID=3154651 RepID=UPI003435E3BD